MERKDAILSDREFFQRQRTTVLRIEQIGLSGICIEWELLNRNSFNVSWSSNDSKVTL